MFLLLKSESRRKLVIVLIAIIITIVTITECSKNKIKSRYRNVRHRTTRGQSTFPLPKTKRICMKTDNTLRARHKSCFLRPDTGPCRADIIQWYFDVKQRRCYRFFWGGCQGNGNRFETEKQCYDHCHLNSTSKLDHLPYFCSLTFDYGNCFGHYNRWTWDSLTHTCRHRLYSGCGGNQNNFESRQECLDTCMKMPNNTLQRFNQFTTCIPFHIAELY